MLDTKVAISLLSSDELLEFHNEFFILLNLAIRGTYA
jgi:hypothetical protein